MRAGQNWSVRAEYDFNAHAPMGDGVGGVGSVMGVAVLYVTLESDDDSDSR